MFESSQTVFRIPPEHYGSTLATFEIMDSRIRDTIVWFVEEMRKGAAPHLILTGAAGNGKTHLCVALYRVAVLDVGTQRTFWAEVPPFCTDVKRTFNSPDPVDHFQDVEDANYFVGIDDLWGRPLSAWEMDNVVFPLINTAHRNHAAVCVTTNYTHSQILETLNPHEVDRLMANARVIHLKGRSRRLA